MLALGAQITQTGPSSTRYDAPPPTETDARCQPGSEVSWTASFHIKARSDDFMRFGKDVGFVSFTHIFHTLLDKKKQHDFTERFTEKSN